jgi:outer membrane receptor protein involved in Fe transport
MINRWTTWVGLFAILTVGTVRVACAQETVAPVHMPTTEEVAEPAKPAVLPRPVTLSTPMRRDGAAEPAARSVFTPTPIDPEPARSSKRWSIRSTYAPVDTGLLVRIGQTAGGDKKDETQPAPQPPAQPTTQPTTPPAPTTGTGAAASFFGLPSVAGAGSASTSAAAATAAAAPAMAATNVAGQSAIPSSSVGNLLANSNSAQGVEVQKRSPAVGDPRIDGLHFGQIVTFADGGYWFPARVDLDTVVSKLNPSDISDILVIRGPFSVRFGPGFAFLDIRSMATPRSTTGEFDVHGGTTLNYRSNGPAFQGQQSLWGGNTNWGFRLTYDVNAAGDYVTGDGTKMPSSYNVQFMNFAYGIDLADHQSLEVRYLHVQQRNVLLPGLLTDINSLVSDAFVARYTVTHGSCFDKLTVDAWVNSTSFNGDSANTQTRAQIPQLNNIFPSNLSADNAIIDATFNPVRLDINTEGKALSYGAREVTMWGDTKGPTFATGLDVRVFRNNYNEFDAFDLSVLPGTGLPANLGIPNAQQLDVGGFADASLPVGEAVILKAGGRLDYVITQFLNFGPNVSVPNYLTEVGDPVNRNFLLFGAYATGELKLNSNWTTQFGYGFAERPPTLTELYTGGAFLGLIQNGFNSIYGVPTLRPEEMHELNASLTAKYEKVRAGGSAFYAFVPNYITYNDLGAFTVNNIVVPGVGTLTGTTPIERLQFMNTGLGTLYGFNAYGEWDALPWLTPFATLSFVEGWDQSRGLALPGIPPLQSRIGLRIHEVGTNPRWGVEYTARMVATQDLFASYLGEQRTGGFVVHYLRAYWQPRTNIQLLAGIENLGNLQYREHLDLRTGFGVFQPGINFYTGFRISY